MIRQPIVSVLGHVDHGKTTLLDRSRGTAVAEREAGGITQHIGATEIPMEVLSRICGGLLRKLKVKVALPGLLFIDTPGHEAFTTLRRRGGALADLAILVVDVNEGFQPQSYEALNILKGYKTPFLVAANKIDKIAGWQVYEGAPFAHSFSKQGEEPRGELEKKVYELVGALYEEGFEAERFDRVKRFEKQVSVVPVSAKTGEGLPELLMMLIGLAQRFMAGQLEVEEESPGRGTILEVKEEVGLGATIDVIIYDGRIRRGDQIVVGARGEPILTKVRSLLKPRPLDEIRDPRYRFASIAEARASCGVKIAAPHLAGALAGAPVRAVEDAEKVREAVEAVKAEMEEVKVETQHAGVVIKADTLGALEALVKMLGEEKIPIRLADVGDVSRRDIVEAEMVKEEAEERAVVLGFNVKVLRDAEERARETGIPIFQGNVIYRLIEDYEDWVARRKERELREEFEKLTKPGKIRLLPGYVFRTSKPAIVGIEVLAGRLKANVGLINPEGKRIGTVKGLQERNENIPEAAKGKQVAMAVEGPTIGKQINEGDILYTDVPEAEAALIEDKYLEALTLDEREAFEEIINIKRKINPTFGRR
jgi:translation initiation factor 5B